MLCAYCRITVPEEFRFCPLCDAPLSPSPQFRTALVPAGSLEMNSFVEGLTISPDGKILAIGCGDKNVYLVDIATSRIIRVLIGHEKSVKAVAFSPNGQVLVSSSDDSTIKCWNTNTGKEIATIDTGLLIKAIAFAPDGQLLATGASDGTIKLWRIAQGREVATLKGHTEAVTSVAFSLDGKFLASASLDTSAKLWEIVTIGYLFKTNTAREVADFKHSHIVTSIAFSPDSKYLITGSDNATIRIWDTVTKKGLGSFEGHAGTVLALAVSPDGKIIASASEDKTIKFWEIPTGRELFTYIDFDLLKYILADNYGSVLFSPDGRLFIHGLRSGEVKIHTIDRTVLQASPPSKKTLTPLKVINTSPISAVAFSPDNKYLAAGSVYGDIYLFDIATLNLARTLSGHIDAVSSLIFNKEGNYLISGSYDGTVRLWQISTGSELLSLKAENEEIGSLALSPNAKLLAIGSRDNGVRIFDLIEKTKEFF